MQDKLLDRQALQDALAEKEKETAVLQEKINYLVDELDRFILITSHDIKNPAQGIMQVASWLQEDYEDALDEDALDLLRMLTVRSQRLMNFANDLIEFSRAKRTLTPIEEVSVAEVVEHVIQALTPLEGFTIEIAENFPTIVVERVKIEQMFRHLIGNALKFHHNPTEGKIQVGWAEANEDFYIFSVTDNGPGIDPKFHEKVFMPYQKLESRDTIEGTGLGLSLVEKVVTFKGGLVTLTSDIGQGTSITFTWPKVQIETNE